VAGSRLGLPARKARGDPVDAAGQGGAARVPDTRRRPAAAGLRAAARGHAGEPRGPPVLPRAPLARRAGRRHQLHGALAAPSRGARAGAPDGRRRAHLATPASGRHGLHRGARRLPEAARAHRQRLRLRRGAGLRPRGVLRERVLRLDRRPDPGGSLRLGMPGRPGPGRGPGAPRRGPLAPRRGRARRGLRRRARRRDPRGRSPRASSRPIPRRPAPSRSRARWSARTTRSTSSTTATSHCHPFTP
jgi:hypothetical protein